MALGHRLNFCQGRTMRSSLAAFNVMQAGHQLVVLEVESSETCDSGMSEEAELHWREDRAAALARCAGVKHIFQRTARDSPDVTFLTLEARLHAACSPRVVAAISAAAGILHVVPASCACASHLFLLTEPAGREESAHTVVKFPQIVSSLGITLRCFVPVYLSSVRGVLGCGWHPQAGVDER